VVTKGNFLLGQLVDVVPFPGQEMQGMIMNSVARWQWGIPNRSMKTPHQIHLIGVEQNEGAHTFMVSYLQ
jgi:hypothetical protein